MKLHAFPILTHLNGQARLPVPPTPRQRIDSCGMRGFVCHARHHAVNNPNDFNSTCPTTQPIADADCPALRQPAPHPPTAASSITALPRSTSSHPSSPSLEPSSAASFLPSASPGSPLLTPASSSSFSSSRGSLPDSPPLSSPGVASRRVVLQAGASAAALLLLLPAGLPVAAAARLLHSRHSAVPCSLTVRNRSPRQVEARWVNFDGDEEPYATILPGHVWTVDTYETHPWRFRDASTGDLVCEYVAQRGDRLLQLYDPPADLLDPDPGSSTTTGEDGGGGSSAGDGEWRRRQRRLRHRRQSERYDQPQLPPDDQVADQVAASDTSGGSSHHQSLSQPPPPQQQQQQQQQQQHPQHPQQQQHLAEVSERPGLAGGFDGLGNPAEQYTAAALLSVVVLAEEAQAVVVLGLEGYERPLSLLVGVPEARNIVNAAGAARGRRPTLLATWVQTLQALGGTLERVVITRQLGGVFYSRVVLSQPWRGPGQAPGPAAGGGAGGGGGVGGDPAVISVDARPSDALALAVEAGADVFVSVPVAELVQQQYVDAQKELRDRLLSPPLEGTEGEEGGGGGRGGGEGRLMAKSLLGAAPSA